MEIINLFLLSVSYSYIYDIEFYIKMLLFFLMSMLVSMFLYFYYFEQKSNQPDGNTFVYFIIHSFIQLIFFLINSFFSLLDKLVELPVLKQIYSFMNEVNKHFLNGRNKIMLTFGQFMFTTFVPQIGLIGNTNSRPPQQRVETINRVEMINDTSNVRVKEESGNIFQDDNDMNNFLDGLLKKDK